MKKTVFLFLFFMLSFTPKLLAKSGFVFGGHVGMLGQTKVENITVKYDNTTDVSGTDTTNTEFGNEVGFKFQPGFKYEFNDKIAFIGLLGFYSRNSDKVLGKRAQLSIFDTSLQVQMHITAGLFTRIGVNIPMFGTLKLEMDDKTKEGLQGGELDALPSIGYDVMMVYELMDNFMVTSGITLTNHDIKEERTTGGYEYTVKFDASNYQIFVGFDYTLPLRFLN